MKVQTNTITPKVLKEEAFQAMTSNNRLMADLATVLNVSLLSMPIMINRRSRRFAELPALSLIAAEMNCTPDELLIESKVPA